MAKLTVEKDFFETKQKKVNSLVHKYPGISFFFFFFTVVALYLLSWILSAEIV